MKKNLLILASIIVVVLAGISLVRSLKERSQLRAQIEERDLTIQRLSIERELNWNLIDSLDKLSFVLELDLQEKEAIIEELRDSLKRTPEIIESLPKGESYDYLQARYESLEEEKEYPFSDIQVRRIHNDVVTKDILVGINSKLTESNAILKQSLDNKEKIEEGLLSIIDTFEEETGILKDENNRLTEKNIKVKTQRNTAVIIAIIEALGIGILIAL